MLRTKYFINLGFNDVQNGQTVFKQRIFDQAKQDVITRTKKNSQNKHMNFMNYICVDIVYSFISQKLYLLMFINV